MVKHLPWDIDWCHMGSLVVTIKNESLWMKNTFSPVSINPLWIFVHVYNVPEQLLVNFSITYHFPHSLCNVWVIFKSPNCKYAVVGYAKITLSFFALILIILQVAQFFSGLWSKASNLDILSGYLAKLILQTNLRIYHKQCEVHTELSECGLQLRTSWP